MKFRLQVSSWALLIALFCASAASAQDAQSAADTSNHIHGVVVNSITHEPIARALVYSNDNRYATLTDGEGRFDFIVAARAATASRDAGTSTKPIAVEIGGPPSLGARKPGFLSQDSGGQSEFVPATPAQKDIVLSLTPEALIVGRVIFPVTDGSNKVAVELYRRTVQQGRAHWLTAGTVETRSDGEFRFAELFAGTYKLFTHEVLDRDPLTFDPRGQLYGYPPVYYPAAADFGSAGVIRVAAGQTFQATLTPVRKAYYRVKIALQNVTPGEPAQVSVSARGHRGPGYSLGYSEENHTIDGMLPNGNYTVEAGSYGPTAATGITNISVRAAALEGALMTMVPNSSIRVNVSEQFTSANADNAGGGVTGIQPVGRRSPSLSVYLQAAENFADNNPSQGASSKGGKDLTIQSVAPGRYWVRADAYRGFVASMTCSDVDLLHYPLLVGAGGAGCPIEVTLRDDGAEVSGTVQASGARPTSSPSVYFIPDNDGSGQFRQINIGPDLSFTLSQIPPGTYRVLAFDRAQPELEYENPEVMREYDSKSVLVHLDAGQKQRIQLTLISTSGQ